MAQIIKRTSKATGEVTWLARVERPAGTSGKRATTNKTFRTKKAAESWARETATKVEAGTYLPPSRQTLGELLTAYLDGPAAQRVRPQTLASYRSVLTSYVLKPGAGITPLADLPVRSLALAHLDRLYSELRAPVVTVDARGNETTTQRSPRTVRYLHTVLRAALRYAVRQRLIPHNPSDFATLPRTKRAELRPLDAAEARRFLDATAEDRWHALFMLLLTGGLRPSEALALRWSDIEWGNGSSAVRVCVQRARVKDAGGYRFDSCKTDRSRRTVTLPAEAAQTLKAHRARQNAEKLAIGAAYKDDGLVFASETGSSPDYRNIVDRHFAPALTRAKLPAMRLYNLRHTAATLLMAAGTHPKIVADRLGHSTITLTMDTYSHVLPNMQRQASDALENLLFSGVGTLLAHNQS